MLEEAGVELGFNYPRPIVSSEESLRDVLWADSIIERCTSNPSGSGGLNNQSRPLDNSGSGSGEALNNGMGGASGSGAAAAGAAGARPASAQGAGASGSRTALQALKQPYRPPTDPAIQAAFLKLPGNENSGGRGGSGTPSIFEALHAVVPDLMGLKMPERLYRR